LSTIEKLTGLTCPRDEKATNRPFSLAEIDGASKFPHKSKRERFVTPSASHLVRGKSGWTQEKMD
jgi:hypothetical protein